MSVDVPVGGAMITTSAGVAYYVWNSATDNVSVSTSNPSNPRKDILVAYVNLAAISSASPNNPSAFNFMVVAGTPASSPSDPSDPTIQSAVGSGNPFIKLRRIAVAANATTITNANITNISLPMALQMPYLYGGSLNTNGHTVPNVADDTLALLNAVQILKGKSISLSGATATGNILTNPFKFSVYRNAAWTSAGSAYGKVNFDTVLYDTSSNYDATTNFRFTALVAGFYHFDAGVKSNAAAGALSGIALYKNGSIEKSVEIENGANTTPIGPGISADIQLAANDTIEVYHYGSASTGSTGKEKTWFSGHLISHL